MRLLDIKRYINIAYENFDPKFSTSGSYYYLDNILQTKKAIKALLDSGILEHSLLKIDIYTQTLLSTKNGQG